MDTTRRNIAVGLGLLTIAGAHKTAKAQAAAGPLTALITATLGNGLQFLGTLTVTGFNVVNGVLAAAGTLNGTATNASGSVVRTITNQAVTLPVTGAAGTCTILTLTLGPLDLNVLGLMIHLNQVVLTITANPAGGLLGQLLCSVANLLNGGLNGLLNSLAGLLNQILAALPPIA